MATQRASCTVEVVATVEVVGVVLVRIVVVMTVTIVEIVVEGVEKKSRHNTGFFFNIRSGLNQLVKLLPVEKLSPDAVDVIRSNLPNLLCYVSSGLLLEKGMTTDQVAIPSKDVPTPPPSWQ